MLRPYLYLEQLERRIDYRFNDRTLLTAALTHRAARGDGSLGAGREANYERLEFEGDAVLSSVVAQHLARTNNKLNEGALTRKRSELTSNARLSRIARELDLLRLIDFGTGDAANSARSDPKVAADVVEAIIGAIARDGGVEAAERFIMRHVLRLKESPGGILSRAVFSSTISAALAKARGAGFGEPHSLPRIMGEGMLERGQGSDMTFPTVDSVPPRSPKK